MHKNLPERNKYPKYNLQNNAELFCSLKFGKRGLMRAVCQKHRITKYHDYHNASGSKSHFKHSNTYSAYHFSLPCRNFTSECAKFNDNSIEKKISVTKGHQIDVWCYTSQLSFLILRMCSTPAPSLINSTYLHQAKFDLNISKSE